MRIGIDARFYGPEGTGIGRYVEKLIENLEKVDQKNEYLIFLRAANFPLYTPKAANFRKIKADARWYTLKEQIIMPAVLAREKLDLVHFPHFNIPLLYPGKFVVTIHDLTKSNFGSGASTTRKKPIFFAKQLAYKLTMNQSLKRAEIIIVPSNFVKEELIKNGVSEEKVVVTYEGADDFYDPRFSVSEGKEKEILGKYSIHRPYLLFVGNTFPYKNLELVFWAFRKLPEDLNLVLVSPRNKFLDRTLQEAKEIGVDKKVVTTGFVPDEELKVLYKQALCFVFPSLSEGFGLPGLEAMGVGCPVIASSSTSLSEIYGEAALYFDPKREQEVALLVNKILKNPTIRSEMIAQGYQQVRKYAWKNLATQTAKIYNLVLRPQ